MEIINKLCEDLITIDPYLYTAFAIALPTTVDMSKSIYEVDTLEVNWRGIRCRNVFWADKQGEPRSCEITQTAIIFNGG